MPVPLIRPGEHEHAGAPGREGRAHLPVEGPGLDVFAVAQAVKPELAHHERAVAGEVLQPGEIGVEALLRLEIDVEAQQIQERQPEVFRGGVIHVGDQPVRVSLLHHAIQPLEIALHLPTAQPACHRSRDLIAERVTQECRMASAGAHLRANQIGDVGGVAATVDQEPDVLLGAEPDHHVQPASGRQVEQRPRRHRVRNPDRVDPGGGHQGEVALDHPEVVILTTLGVRREGAIRDAADAQLGVADEEELAAYARPRGRGQGAGDGLRCRNGTDALRAYRWSRRVLTGGCRRGRAASARPVRAIQVALPSPGVRRASVGPSAPLRAARSAGDRSRSRRGSATHVPSRDQNVTTR